MGPVITFTDNSSVSVHRRVDYLAVHSSPTIGKTRYCSLTDAWQACRYTIEWVRARRTLDSLNKEIWTRERYRHEEYFPAKYYISTRQLDVNLLRAVVHLDVLRLLHHLLKQGYAPAICHNVNYRDPSYWQPMLNIVSGRPSL